ncbi:hypothetical protein CLOP_g25711 [Closterium sp. NIES-67]|nr:hypothetical protein CLOP_g25711 [Closterium sp. NIES-67]
MAAVPSSVPRRLVVTDAPVISCLVVADFCKSVGGGDALESAIQSTVVVTNARQADSKKLPSIASGSLESVLSIAERPGHHDATCLSELARVLQPNGTLLLQEPVAARSAAAVEQERLPSSLSGSPLPNQAALERTLLLSGFATWQAVSSVAGVGLAPEFTGITPAAYRINSRPTPSACHAQGSETRLANRLLLFPQEEKHLFPSRCCSCCSACHVSRGAAPRCCHVARWYWRSGRGGR